MEDRKIRTERKISNYGGKTAIGHVYDKFTMYGGSDKPKKRDTLIYNNGKLENHQISTPEGVHNLFLEILTNSADNVENSRRAGVDPGIIEVVADKKTIKITNGGLAIPVEKIFLQEKGSDINIREYREGDTSYIWLPAFIFGYLRSSSNYDKNAIRTVAGTNGYGAKLVSILSKMLKLINEDPKTKRCFTGIWKDNMFKDNPERKPEIEVVEDKNIKKGKVSVEWTLDFERFGIKEYSDLDLALFCRFTVDLSFSCKIKTSFNGVEFDYRNIYDFAKLLFKEEEIAYSMVKYSWPKLPEDMLKNGDEVLTKKIIEAKKAEHIPELEVLVLDTPDNGRVISYVNGLITSDGGVHVDAVQEPISTYICNIINGDKKRIKDKSNQRSGIITSSKIKPHLSFIINARLIDTSYNSQIKSKLTSPQPYFQIEEKKLKVLNEWKIISRLYAELEAMAFKSASKSDGKKNKHIKEEKGFDANRAGTKDSLKCVCRFCEGASASGYPRNLISMLEGGKDYNGLGILKGKLLNVTNAKPEQYANNTVFAYVKQMLGLKEGLDYNSKANLQTLRYGFVIICVDADDDGMHILSHFLNFFREKFPGILRQNMIAYLRTPVIKLFKKDKISKRFFSVHDFNVWKEKNSIKGYEIRYYKGLGSSEVSDIKDDLKNAPTIYCIYDEKSNEGFDLAFHKRNSDRRKEWIAKWRDVSQVDDVVSVDLKDILKDKNSLEGAQDISQLLNRELINYSVSSLFRAIPSQYDHLKVSQRKALFAALKYFNYNPNDKAKRIKVGRLVYKAADMTQYHHGEKSLIDTFIKMAQDFTGSNNMGFFYKGGSFGTREDGGDGAADARYSETHLSWWIPYVYYKESVELIPKHIIEGDECEPYWLPGVIPMGIVNGTNGIATGFSTSSPPHHPVDVIEWYEKKCRGETPEPLIPWFNNFVGRREIKTRDKMDDLEEELLPRNNAIDKLEKTIEMREDEEHNRDISESMALLNHAETSRLSLKTYGKFQIESAKNDYCIIRITELPIRSWSDHYKNWLQTMLSSKGKEKAILDFDNHSSPNKADFTIKWNKNYPKKPDLKTLRLTRSFGISNITLIDHKGFPTQFDKIYEVMECYYKHMIKHYTDLREFRISNEKRNVQDISYRMKFIVHVLKEEIKIRKVKEETIIARMKELEIPFVYYEKSKTRDFSEESLAKYRKELEEAKVRLAKAIETSAQAIWLEKLDLLKKEILKRKKGKFFNFEK